MRLKQIKPAMGSAAALTAAVLAGTMMITSPSVHANDSQGEDPRIQTGLKIAPVKLNTKGLNSDLVGIGSYIVNAQGDCNGCHTSPDYGPEYSKDPTFVGNPPPGVVNPAAYLGGGTFFATFPGGANIFSRNLTPDITGLPEGGHTLDQFKNILKTGHDYDKAHPPCPATGAEGCILGPPTTPLNGNVLQIMPWPVYGKMSDDDIAAMYEYLKAIPCISHQGPVPLPPGTPPLPSILYQSCPKPEGGHDK
jgi:mono/diheme cytochrome c family protein